MLCPTGGELSRRDYEDMIRATDRAINFLVVWKRVYGESGKCMEQPSLICKTDSMIASFAEYRFALKRVLTGAEEPSLEEQLRLTRQEYENASDPGTKQLYLDRLLKLTGEIVTEGLLRGADV